MDFLHLRIYPSISKIPSRKDRAKIMPENIVVEIGAPTLAGIKTGSLINVDCGNDTKRKICQDIRDMNRSFSGKGIRAVPLRFHNGKVLLYLYRPLFLEKDLANEQAKQLLKKRHYPLHSIEDAVATLAKKTSLCSCSQDFPHEIGLFLGYPAEDVKAFIEHKYEGCKLVGTWKVYGDVEKSAALFARYRRCTNSYRLQWRRGKSLYDLTVRT